MTAVRTWTADDLYRLLPAVYRLRDVEQGSPLHELLSVVADQVAAVAESLDQAYDDQFIETCAEWVAPYIGDLIGYRTLNGVVPQVASPRAEVANTIRYRRRKGTAAMLEQLARDVTGWPARAVEFFEVLATTQYMNHLRPQAVATVSLRDAGRLELVGTAFDDFAHTGEMRRISTRSGRYNIPNVGLFLWRVEAIPLSRVPLVAADGTGRRFRIDALGVDRQLYGVPRTEEEITHLAEPADVPLGLSRRRLDAHLADYYGEGRSLLLETLAVGSSTEVGADAVHICDLSDDPAVPGAWTHEPTAADTHVAVDPVLGRVAFASASAAGERRVATSAYGSALHVGAGGYDRADSLDPAPGATLVSAGVDLQPPLDAIAAGGVVQVQDSDRYDGTLTIHATTPAAGAAEQQVVLRAANLTRPLLTATAPLRLDLEPDSTVVLEGLLIAGGPLVLPEHDDVRPRTLILRHCTLVPGLGRTPDNVPVSPGSASVLALHPFAEVRLERCISGPVVAVDGAHVVLVDSVVDAGAPDAIAYCGRDPVAGGDRDVTTLADGAVGDGLAPGGAVELDACTVIGRVHAQQLDASNSALLAAQPDVVDAWLAPVWAERRQVGCVRFCYVPASARTGRRFRCVPDDEHPHVRPHLTSVRFGDAGYVQLQRGTPDAIRTGADDGSEMGVTHYLYAPQREENVLLRLDEYLRFGLEAGVFFAS